LTKDKKRIDGHEIAVHLAWESTLYVTNFPEKYDDASVRELFGKARLITFSSWLNYADILYFYIVWAAL
jgi:squamous cell carcinoma antigen recognized by T-cells 3